MEDFKIKLRFNNQAGTKVLIFGNQRERENSYYLFLVGLENLGIDYHRDITVLKNIPGMQDGERNASKIEVRADSINDLKNELIKWFNERQADGYIAEY